MSDRFAPAVTSSDAEAADVGATGQPAWRRIAEDLMESIGRGEPPVGGSLPTALALAERYGVHRHTVRQAFRHLQDIGLVSVEQGRGTFVIGTRLPYRLGRRVRLRENLRESGASVHVRLLGSAIAPGSDEVSTALGLAVGQPVVQVRTLSRIMGLPSSISVVSLDASRFPDFALRLERSGNSITAALQSCGVADYVRVWTRITARLARPDELELLERSAGLAVLETRALDGLASGEPLSHVDTVIVGDRLELVVEH